MNVPERVVHTVRLSAPREELIRRGAILLEDAFRTASLPETERRRLIIVRKLALGKINPAHSPATIALLIERQMQYLGSLAVYAADPASVNAPAVYFHDETEPYSLLATHLAQGEATDAWFWTLAIPDWHASMPDPLRTLLYTLVERQGTAAMVSFVAGLHERGVLDKLLITLQADDGARLQRWFSGGTSIPMPTAAMHVPKLAPAIVRWSATWGAEDARSVWLAAVILAAENPARLATPTLLAQAQLVAQRSVFYPNTLSIVNDQAPAPDQLTLPSETSAAMSDSRVEVAREQIVATTEPMVQVDTPPLTAYGGLYFLLPVMTRLGMDAWLAKTPSLLEAAFPARVLRFVATCFGAGIDDPALAALMIPEEASVDAPFLDEELTALCGYTPAQILRLLTRLMPHRQHQGDPAELALGAWLIALRRWVRRYTRMGLRDVIKRRGYIRATRTHIDIFFEHRRADLRIRMVGLDLDPGWVAWFGRVVAFHYVDEGTFYG